MAILETEAVQLSNAVRDAMVALRTLVNGNQLTNNLLETTAKTDLVSAVNELKASIDALSYDDLADLPTIPATVAELTDANTYDFPTLNTPVADALAGKANSADLGSIATFEGNQNLRTTDPATFAGVYSLSTAGIESASLGNAILKVTRNDNINYSAMLNYYSGNSLKWAAGLSDAGDFTGSTGLEYLIGSGSKNNPVFLISSSNNVGIGTTTPTEKLDVVGNIKASGTVTLGNGTSVAPSFILGSGWNRGLYSPAGGRIVYAANDVSQFLLGPSEMTLRVDMGMGWTSGNAYGVAVDTTINRLSAGVVGVPSITASGTVTASGLLSAGAGKIQITNSGLGMVSSSAGNPSWYLGVQGSSVLELSRPTSTSVQLRNHRDGDILLTSAGGSVTIGAGGNLTASGTVSAADVTATGTVTANTVVLPGGGYLKQYVGGTIGSSGSFVAYGYYIGQNTTSGALLPEAGGGFFTKNLRIVGNLTASCTVTPGSKTVAAANALSGVAEGSLLWITNEAGGPCTAEYNGTAWVRVRDQIAISV